MHSKTRLNTQYTAQPTPGGRLLMTDNLTSIRELDSRLVDWLHVRLWWDADSGCVWVSVLDKRSGDAFCIEVKDGQQALDVFHHPFAYVRYQHVETIKSIQAAAG